MHYGQDECTSSKPTNDANFKIVLVWMYRMVVLAGSPSISGAVTRRHWLQIISNLLVF